MLGIVRCRRHFVIDISPQKTDLKLYATQLEERPNDFTLHKSIELHVGRPGYV